jgi:uncharacterized membrane protein HdeD (DUF308 family)
MAERIDNRIWGGLALRGVVAILFGILALARPGITVQALLYLFGAFAIFDGIFALVSSFQVAQFHGTWWPMLIVGLAGIAFGVLAFASPTATAVVLAWYIGAWAIVSGFFEIGAAYRLGSLIQDQWLLVVAGILSIAFGILVWAHPGPGILAILWIIGLFAILFGVLMEGLAFRVQDAQHRVASARASSA